MLDTGDVVQEAVIAACRHLDTLDIRHDGAVQAYLRQAVRNRIIDVYRRSTRRPVRADLPQDVAAQDVSQLDAVIGEELRHEYKSALTSLSSDDREAIVLRVEGGLAYAEIAERMNKPSADAARMTVARALARLARAMRRGPQDGL